MSILRCVAVVFLASGCSIPAGFIQGDKTIHSNFGYSLSSQSEDSFNLEIATVEYGPWDFSGEDRKTEAQEIFIIVAEELAAGQGRTIDPPQMEQASISYHYDFWLGINTARVRHWMKWRIDGDGAAEILAGRDKRRAEAKAEEERKKAALLKRNKRR